MVMKACFALGGTATSGSRSNYIFRGGAEEAERVSRELPPEQTLVAVRGNNDWGAGFPETCQLHLEGRRIFIAHGHTYRVKYGLKDFCDAARSRQADVALFGHTHQSLTLYEDGLYLMNPGALSYGRGGPSYGLVDLIPGRNCYMGSNAAIEL